MSHESRPPPVARPLALVMTGGREEAMALEEALRRYFAAGLERLADDGAANPRAALEALEDCARAAVARYNGKHDRTPDRAIRADDEV
jgi:glycine/D-amino acid oxidase-like deaminating enzyme